MPELSLAELVRLARDASTESPQVEESARYVYIRIGKDGKRGLNTEVRTTVEGKDLMLDLDEAGQIYGIEFWT
jgi:uncharacterized protein YuzE